MSSPQPHLTDLLDPADRGAVLALAAAATAEDGVKPLSEATTMALAAGPGRVRHLVAYAGDAPAGYAQLAVAPEEVDDGPGEPPSAELVVGPSHRRSGIGRSLVDALVAAAPDVRVWAHGDLPAARALAAAAGLEAGRELRKMARPLEPADAAPVELPAGFTARAFEPGRDEQAWLATNAAAFAHHPEQGRMTLADLRERMEQPWFDPAGFILVTADEAPEQVAAFHWTKVDPEQRSALDPSATAGEVYVVGVHPAYQGRGLGRPVTALGLAHLAGLGLPEVVLYVDGDNHAAVRTYTGLGFRSIMVDVMYSRTVHR